MREADFIAAILRNPVNSEILRRLPGLGLPDCWLVAGCLFQTVWNLRSSRPPGDGIKDYDIFYFDGTDLSWEAEDRVIRRVSAAFSGLTAQGIVVEVRNQARVHLWYPQRFGSPYPALSGSRDGIARFLVAGTCVGVQPDELRPVARVCAPYGLEDLAEGVLRPGPLLVNTPLYQEKVASYRARWPWLHDLAADGTVGAAPMDDSPLGHGV